MFPVVNQTYATLDAAANPSSTTEPENYAQQFFDAQAITTAVQNITTFFQGNPSQFFSNFPYNGQFPANQYFTIWQALATFYFVASDTADATGGAATSPLHDLGNILFTCGASYLLTLNQKKYGPIPLYNLGCAGGVTGLLAAASEAATVGVNVVASSVANNGIIGKGWCYANNLILQPMTPFAVNVALAVAPTITQTPVNLAIALDGTHSRKIQ